MAAFETQKAELEGLGATIIAASVDTLEQAQEVVGRGLTYRVAYGLTKEDGDTIGAWWESQRGYIQPAEFMIGRAVLSSAQCMLLGR